jgi:hypothetical protein
VLYTPWTRRCGPTASLRSERADLTDKTSERAFSTGEIPDLIMFGSEAA